MNDIQKRAIEQYMTLHGIETFEMMVEFPGTKCVFMSYVDPLEPCQKLEEGFDAAGNKPTPEQFQDFRDLESGKFFEDEDEDDESGMWDSTQMVIGNV